MSASQGCAWGFDKASWKNKSQPILLAQEWIAFKNALDWLDVGPDRKSAFGVAMGSRPSCAITGSFVLIYKETSA